ncbi:MAG TPA: hypothetical protein VGI46_14930 [Candidatus Acidoferrum sp.]|jgi:hypothetical protein
MKVSRLSVTVLGGSLLLAVSAVAGDTIKKSLHVYENVTVGGTQLTPGDYKVEWSGPGPDVKVSILKGKQTVATVPARIESENSANTQAGYALTPGKDGGQTVAEIFFTGEKYELKIDQGANAGQSQGATSGSSN